MSAAWLRHALIGNARPSTALDDGLDAAKLAAIALMAVNHTLLALPDPWRIWGHVVGRPCVPIFVFVMVVRLAEGSPERATHLLLLLRLLLWGALSQPVYYALIGAFTPRLNILFTLAAGAALILLAIHRRYLPLAAGVVLVVLTNRFFDGGAITPIAQLAAYLIYRRSPLSAMAVVTAAAVVENLIDTPLFRLAALAVLGAPLLLLVSPALRRIVPRMPGLVFYVFYPAHFMLIWLAFGPYR